MGVAIVFALSSPQGTRRLLRGIKKEWNAQHTKRVLIRLQERRLIGFHEERDGTISVLLTKEGESKLEEWNLEQLQVKKPKRWDGRWRVIVFDIAEKRKKAREAFRDMLKRLECYPLQKSIFVHPYSCEAEIAVIKKVFHIPDQEVLYFSSDLIPREHFLKKNFKLL